MAVRPETTHQCEWREKAEALEGEVSGLKGQLSQQGEALARMQPELAALTRRVLGPKSEKMPPISKELAAGAKADPAATKKKRQERRAARAALVTMKTVHEVPAQKRHCPQCDSQKLSAMPSKTCVVYEYVPA